MNVRPLPPTDPSAGPVQLGLRRLLQIARAASTNWADPQRQNPFLAPREQAMTHGSASLHSRASWESSLREPDGRDGHRRRRQDQNLLGELLKDAKEP